MDTLEGFDGLKMDPLYIICDKSIIVWKKYFKIELLQLSTKRSGLQGQLFYDFATSSYGVTKRVKFTSETVAKSLRGS